MPSLADDCRALMHASFRFSVIEMALSGTMCVLLAETPMFDDEPTKRLLLQGFTALLLALIALSIWQRARASRWSDKQAIEHVEKDAISLHSNRDRYRRTWNVLGGLAGGVLILFVVLALLDRPHDERPNALSEEAGIPVLLGLRLAASMFVVRSQTRLLQIFPPPHPDNKPAPIATP